VKDRVFESIALRGIHAWGRHGANAGEQDVPQPLDIDVDLMVDVRAARTSDALADTIDYAAVHARVVRIVATEHYRLLERLGESIATALMDDERIVMANVIIAKPGILDGATPSVSVSKMRMSSIKSLGKRQRKPKREREGKS
jgi:dihydroneopterin aldolase